MPTTQQLLLAAYIAVVCGQAQVSAGQAQPAARPTGLPSKVKWTFNFDAGWGTFGFGNSLFEDPKEGVGGNFRYGMVFLAYSY